MEETIARLASAKKGVVTWAELRGAGISVAEVKWRAKTGYLIRVHRGVYRVGHRAPSTAAGYLAAVKACGTEAYLWHRAAAHMQGLTPLTRKPPPAEVMCSTERSVPGVRTKRVRRIHRLDVCTNDGIPMTTVPRTLLDLAATLTEDELARAAHEAWIKHRVGRPQVLAVIDRHPNAKGAAKLRRVMGGEVKLTLSELEREFLHALREAGIEAPPEVNRTAGSKSVDCRWPGRLTVELDSFRFHNTRHTWEGDRRREREARKREEAFRRYTWHDLTEERAEMLEEVRRLASTPLRRGVRVA